MTFDYGTRARVPELPVVDLDPGDKVEFTAGRYYGSTGILEEIQTIPTPSGREIAVARVRRPRAGETWEFPCCLRRVT